MPIPRRPGEDVTLDFVPWLPECEGFDSVVVVVDRLTKLRHVIPGNETVNSMDVARMLLDNVRKLHDLLKKIISDRSPQFVSSCWKDLWELLEIKPFLSPVFHPDPDGQTERVNVVM